MKRRGFVGRLLGALAVAPAVVLAKKAGVEPAIEVIEPIEEVTSTKGIDAFIKTNVWSIPKTGEEIALYMPDSTPLLTMAEKMKVHRGGFEWLTKKEYPRFRDNTVEHHSIGVVLGMESREMVNPKYEWLVRDPNNTYPIVEYNYLQIVRTPVAWAGRDRMTPKDMEASKRHALREHLRQIYYLLELGKRHKDDDPKYHGDATYTGGRQFFNSTAKGRVAYMRNRGLVWMMWQAPDTDTIHGEWLSDIGWAP